jgi:predicted metal-dependent hydrolase
VIEQALRDPRLAREIVDRHLVVRAIRKRLARELEQLRAARVVVEPDAPTRARGARELANDAAATEHGSSYITPIDSWSIRGYRRCMPMPIPRAIDLDLAGVPRRWVANSTVATAISNGVNILFPHGERFFVRSVNKYLERVTDPVLRAQVKAFFKQEGHHAHAHDEFNAILRAQGYDIDRFLERYRAISARVEALVPDAINLAGTAAAEHFTAILADGAFSKGILDSLDPRMQRLMAWHAAEEIEHKAVAFDVLETVSDSYALRIAGLAYATVMLGGFWLAATTMLLRQDRIGWRAALRELRTLRDRDPVIRRVFVAGIRQYLRRDFHPSDNANDHLAAEWLASHGIALPDAA